jgi:hypothetical protein
MIVLLCKTTRDCMPWSDDEIAQRIAADGRGVSATMVKAHQLRLLLKVRSKINEPTADPGAAGFNWPWPTDIPIHSFPWGRFEQRPDNRPRDARRTFKRSCLPAPVPGIQNPVPSRRICRDSLGESIGTQR